MVKGFRSPSRPLTLRNYHNSLWDTHFTKIIGVKWQWRDGAEEFCHFLQIKLFCAICPLSVGRKNVTEKFFTHKLTRWRETEELIYFSLACNFEEISKHKSSMLKKKIRDGKMDEGELRDFPCNHYSAIFFILILYQKCSSSWKIYLWVTSKCYFIKIKKFITSSLFIVLWKVLLSSWAYFTVLITQRFSETTEISHSRENPLNIFSRFTMGKNMHKEKSGAFRRN